ncbi:hypothetical protein ABL78_6204 [Leptomonas seymouri]|uniref:Nucleoplasmin-like domain-containing protein n=1 Tax=Leptomonas seymouri TaxID=5684 RepID=A0A0N0P4E4_LEPSE|nr:hypothetical protein ABL78_6204 [Leptomonas seymouri]|eukprot:KPI84737.1 hypothetical protein ABL78_6204 [Leptomonas seymouri]
MLNCFFGAELKPDGVAVNFTVPKGSTLVITQCAVTSVVPPRPAASEKPADSSPETAAGSSTSSSSSPSVAQAYSPVTLCVQGHGVPTRFAVCSLSPAQQITYCPLQLIFSKPVSFALVPQTVNSAPAAAAPPTQLRHIGKKAQREQRGERAVAGGAAAAVYPTVHLTGYYEQAADDDEMDDGGMAMEMMEDDDDSDDE